MELYMSYYSVLPHYRLTHDISLDLISSDVESDNDTNTTTRAKSTSEKVSHRDTCTKKDSLNDNLTGKTTSEILTIDNVNQNCDSNSCLESPKQKHRVEDESSSKNSPVESNSNQSANIVSTASKPQEAPSLSPATAPPTNLNCSVKKRTYSFSQKTGSPVVASERHSKRTARSMVHLNLFNKASDSELDIRKDCYRNKKKHEENGKYQDNRLHDSENHRTELGSPQEVTLEVIDKSMPSPDVPHAEVSAPHKICDEAKVIENVQRNMRKRANVSKKGKRLRKLPQTPEREFSPEALSPLPCMTKSLAEELLEVHSKTESEVNEEEDDQNDQLAGLTSMHDSFYGGKLGMCEDEGDDEEVAQMGEGSEMADEAKDCQPQVIQLDENFFLRKTADYDQYYKKNNTASKCEIVESECKEEKRTENGDCEPEIIKFDENFSLRKRSEYDQKVQSDHHHKKSTPPRSVSESNLVHKVIENKGLRITNGKSVTSLTTSTSNKSKKAVKNIDDNHENNANGFSELGNNKLKGNDCVNKDGLGLEGNELDCQSLVRELNHLSDDVEYIDDDPGDNPKCRQLSEMMTLNFNTTSDAPKKAYLSSDNPYLQTDASPEEKPRRRSSFLGLLGKKTSTESNHSASGSSPRSSMSDDDWDLLDATHRGCHKFIPRHADEMPVEIGDPIHVFCEADDMWCEGINLRLKQKGVFPSVYATDLDFLESEGETRKLARYTLHFLGSVEVNYHKGNDVICQAMQKVIMTRRMTLNSSPPSLCCLEITEYGIKMINKSKKNKRHSTLPKNNSIKKKIAKILTKDREGSSTNEQFFSLKNISFCGHHPRNDHYFAFITKHPLEMRFACHVFVAEFSTKPVCAAFGRAFKKFYQEYMAFSHPTEDIYME